MEKLVAKRGHIKGGLTRIRAGLTDEFLSQASLQLLIVKEEKVIQLYGEYEKLLIEISDGEDPAKVEQCYFESMELIRTQLALKKSAETTSTCVSKINLPNIELKPFSGDYLEFKSFKEMFFALIHKDKGIDDIQKFFYLRSFLKGEAYDLIKNLPIVGSSYNEAWYILDDRYDNRLRTIFEHVTKLLEIPPINKQDIIALRTLIAEARQQVAALKNLGQAVDKWDSILICIILRKLDPLTRESYHLDKEHMKSPTFANFIKFLESRATAKEDGAKGEVKTTGAAASA